MSLKNFVINKERISIAFYWFCFIFLKYVLIIRFVGRKIPQSQIATFYFLRRFIMIAEKHQIVVWAFAGTLLGAIRGGNFAGRPSDLDFHVRCQDAQTLKAVLINDLIPRHNLMRVLPLVKNSFRVDYSFDSLTRQHLFKFKCLRRTLQLFEIKEIVLIQVDGQNYFEFNSIMNPKERDKLPVREFEALRKSWIYGVQVNVLENSEEYLELHYGSDWMTPKADHKALSERCRQVAVASM